MAARKIAEANRDEPQGTPEPSNEASGEQAGQQAPETPSEEAPKKDEPEQEVVTFVKNKFINQTLEFPDKRTFKFPKSSYTTGDAILIANIRKVASKFHVIEQGSSKA